MSPSNLAPDVFQALIEQTNQAFFAYDIGSKAFTYLSPAFLSSFKMSAENTAPKTLLALVHPDDQSFVQERLTQLFKQGVSAPVECRIQLPGQEEQWMCLTASLLEKPAGTLLLGHVEEITAQRQYNDHLKKFSNKKNSVLNILSHDLAGPLGMIQNLSHMLAEQLRSEVDEETQNVLHLIERISHQGSELLREFMNQEFLESSHTHLVTRRVNLVEKIREMLEEYTLIGDEFLPKEVNFLCDREEIYAEIDDLKFMQTITNLISNALKFTPDGGIINVSLEEEGESVLVKVSDTGVGIPEKYHATLFEKFTNARRPGLKGEKSVGLGMSIVKTIVEWHHGQIWFNSAENEGTTFFIRIPKNPPASIKLA